ncbi:splicing factor, arginine/serine-rich 15-like [Takifugu rubripes]|uniref:splicing factor, arginine/serine-rich 15-like n=1 Tax=Takifugu rubripes TaxID=31033 RepID=UPI0011456FBA|nr:splicing factor, arginine/serine-rich 15-like [Takifugu rubripes]
MDAVNAFNMELFSMIDMKPPISRAKMMSVTKAAIKAIKLYKHVVQIVEKFIKKCKPELKVPGLYVIDSIVRQSRHQFGVDKDVFGPRFLKNFTETFQNLYHCQGEDKTKIVRVLNLWQKNGVFDTNILQSLVDMANGNISPNIVEAAQTQLPVTSPTVVSSEPQLPTTDALAAVAQLFQSQHGQELQRILQNFQQADKTFANNSLTPPHMPVTPLGSYNAHKEKKSSLAEKLLDRFEYDDDPEDVTAKEGNTQPQGISEKLILESVHMLAQASGIQDGKMSHAEHQTLPDRYHPINDAYSYCEGSSREDSGFIQEGRHRSYNRRSGSRSPRRRRSRSSSRSRRGRPEHSRPRERRWRSRSGDTSERENRERRQKGLPTIKSHTLSVCSTTLWIGQLDKKTQQSDVVSLLEEFGQIESINMIPPRGCAYIVMVHRQDAYTALNKLSRGSYRVNQKPVKIAWALNKGIKSTHKKFWDVEQGVTYIPWSKVRVEDLESYREGGTLDADTLDPAWNIANDLKMVAANGALESMSVDGVSQVQTQPLDQATPIGSPLRFTGAVVMPPASMPPAETAFMHVEIERTVLPPGNEEDSKANDILLSMRMVNQLGTVLTIPAPRSGFPHLQPPASTPGPCPSPFLSPPYMPHLPPQMMHRRPVFPPGRYSVAVPFPPRDPLFHQHPAMEPEGMDDGEVRHFGNGNPRFPHPRFHRGSW